MSVHRRHYKTVSAPPTSAPTGPFGKSQTPENRGLRQPAELVAVTGWLGLKNRLLMPEEDEVDVRSDTEVPSKGLVERGHNDLRDDTL